jgi:O-antigen ligase
MLPRGTLTRFLRILLILSVVPIVISINRGLWLSLGAGLLYVVIRAALSKNKRAVGAAVGAFIVAAALVFATPLGGLVHDRFANQNNSNQTRMSVYKQTINDVEDSPFLGYGSPHKKIDRHQEARVGTQGQAFMVLYSHGIPGLVFFVSFFGYVLVRSARAGSPGRYWAHVAILIAVVEMPYYNYMPTTLHVLMIAIALAWRDILDPVPRAHVVAPARTLALA